MKHNAYRLGLAVAIGTLLMLVWSAGALGIIGDGGRADLMYLGVLGVLVPGALAVRCKPQGMAIVLAATAVVPALIAGIALAAGLQDDPGASVAEILGVNAMFVALFGLSAWLFRRAADAPDLTNAAS